MADASTPPGGFPASAFGPLAEYEDGNFWYEARNRLIVWLIRRYFPDTRTFLEIGCGTGFVLRGIHRAFPEIALTGTELHDAGLEWARVRVPSAILREADVSERPPGAEYDLVGMFDVLEHIADDERVLREVFAATRPGGGLLISVPQHPWLWGPLDEYARHVRRYRARQLIERVRRAGFEVVRTTGFLALLLPLMVVSRLSDRVRRGSYDPWRELKVPRAANACLGTLLDVERLLITWGISFPAGGSLFLVARRPLRDAIDREA